MKSSGLSADPRCTPTFNSNSHQPGHGSTHSRTFPEQVHNPFIDIVQLKIQNGTERKKGAVLGPEGWGGCEPRIEGILQLKRGKWGWGGD